METMQLMTFGKLTPGEVLDLQIMQQIKDLNDKFRHVNFGIDLTDADFDFFLPKWIDKEKNKVMYREWKMRQIYLKQFQLE
jgi:hypothetical protein